MGISTEYREFRSREGYDQFFQEVRNSGSNHVDMFVPSLEDGRGRRTLQKTYVVHPDIDFKLLDFVISQPQYDGRWVIKPVENLTKYRENTDKRSYRVALRKQQVIDYRRLMTKENVFMPFLVFDADRKLWLSGRHRCEACKKFFGAVFALVLEGLTDEEALYITDITNQWHQESWGEDERALIALEYTLQGKMTEKEALEHEKLDPNDRAPILGAMLYRRWDQSPTDRRLLESGVEGHGHPFKLKGIGEKVKIFGEDSIEKFPIKRWLYLKEPEARAVLSALRGGANSRGFVENRSTWTRSNVREVVRGKLIGNDCDERWKDFLSRIKTYRNHIAVKASGVNGPTDDRIWMNFVFKYKATSDAGLAAIKKELTKKELKQSAEVVSRLERTFGK